MHEQVAIPASREMVSGKCVIVCVGLSVGRTDRCDWRILVMGDQGMAHERRNDDEQHGKHAKPRCQTIAGTCSHDERHRDGGWILAEASRGNRKIVVGTIRPCPGRFS